MLTPTLRLILALVAFSSWMVLLMSGVHFGGAVYLLLAASLAVFPWRILRSG